MIGRDRLDAVRDGLRTQLWPVPAIGIAIGLALGIGVPRLDAHIDGGLSATFSTYFFGGGPSAARTIFGAIASSLITVTSLTFSLTVVTLQLASSQFSPRLLRTFTRDRFVHLTLALFLGTFTFSLAALRSVRDATEGSQQFVPRISVTLAFVLAVASVIGLVLFLAHLAREIRVETMLRRVRRDASETFNRVLSEREPRERAAAAPTPPPATTPLLAASSGFLVGLDEEALVAAATDVDAVLALDRYPGDTVVAATPLGLAWPVAGPFDGDAIGELRTRVAAAVTTEFERTGVQDYGFGLRQLTDVATKALSPGINDPTTAIHALTHSSALLCELTSKDLEPRVLCDGDGEARVVLHPPGFEALLDLSITQPRRYGGGDPFVLEALLVLLREVAWCARTEGQGRAISEQLRRLRRTIAGQDFDRAEIDRLSELSLLVEGARAGRWDTPGRAVT